MFMVIAATDDKELNHHIAGICNSKRNYGKCCGPERGLQLYLFVIYKKKKNLIAAFSSGGNSPCAGTIFKKSGKRRS